MTTRGKPSCTFPRSPPRPQLPPVTSSPCGLPASDTVHATPSAFRNSMSRPKPGWNPPPPPLPLGSGCSSFLGGCSSFFGGCSSSLTLHASGEGSSPFLVG